MIENNQEKEGLQHFIGYPFPLPLINSCNIQYHGHINWIILLVLRNGKINNNNNHNESYFNINNT